MTSNRQFIYCIRRLNSHSYRCFRNNSSVAGSDRKAIVLLDVDGVLNIVSQIPAKVPGMKWDSTEFKKAICGDGKKTYNIVWAQSVVDKLNDLSRAQKVEIRWLTTWDQYAQLSIAPTLGLDEFSLARNPEEKISKLVAASRIANENPDSPMIWIDDDLPYFFREKGNGNDVLCLWSLRKHALFVQPSLYLGLQPQHFALMDMFLANVAKDKVHNNFLEGIVHIPSNPHI